jgi:hypothetical protein
MTVSGSGNFAKDVGRGFDPNPEDDTFDAHSTHQQAQIPYPTRVSLRFWDSGMWLQIDPQQLEDTFLFLIRHGDYT